MRVKRRFSTRWGHPYHLQGACATCRQTLLCPLCFIPSMIPESYMEWPAQSKGEDPSDDHPSLTLLAKILLPSASPPWHVSWEKALFAGKYPYVHLVPLNVGSRGQLGSVVTKSGLGQDKAGVAGVIGQ